MPVKASKKESIENSKNGGQGGVSPPERIKSSQSKKESIENAREGQRTRQRARTDRPNDRPTDLAPLII